MLKNVNSIISLRTPGTATGAFPDLLRSPGTLNTPQTTAAAIGIETDNRLPSHGELLEPYTHPHIPNTARADSSSRKRTARFIGCVAIPK
jgi:hypothetical protein